MLSLIFGIVSLVSMAVGYLVNSADFLIWIGVALGIVAWITGAKAVKRDGTDRAARAGKILGIIATIIGIILVVFVIILAGALIGIASNL